MPCDALHQRQGPIGAEASPAYPSGDLRLYVYIYIYITPWVRQPFFSSYFRGLSLFPFSPYSNRISTAIT